MSGNATGQIRIEGDATEFERMVEDVLRGNRAIETDTQQMGTSVGESFVTVANNTLGLFEKVKGYVVGIKDHIVSQMKLASEVERGDVAWKMLRRQNEELFQASQHTMEYSAGLIKVRDSVFIINDVMSKGIKLNKGLYQDLIQTATTASIRLNKPITAMIDQFVAMSTKMEANSEEMKMLGIQIETDKVFINYASQIGVAVTKLTEAQKKTAFLKELLNQLGEKDSVSFAEVNVLTSITQSYEKYTDFAIDVNERYANKISSVGVALNEFFTNDSNRRGYEAKKHEEILSRLGGKYKTWGELVTNNTNYINGEALSMGVLAEAEHEIEVGWKKLKKEMSDDVGLKMWKIALRDLEAQFSQGVLSLDEYDKGINELTKGFSDTGAIDTYILKMEALDKARWSLIEGRGARELYAFDDKDLFGGKSKERMMQVIKDREARQKREKEEAIARAKATKAQLLSELESNYEATNAFEAKTYSEQVEWEKKKALQVKFWSKQKTQFIREELEAQKAFIFATNKTKKEDSAFQQIVEADKQWYSKWESDITPLLQKVKDANSELFTSIHKSVMDSFKGEFMDAQTDMNGLENARNKEIERFKTYANEKKMTAESLNAGLLEIDKRYVANKQQLNIEEFNGLKETKTMMSDMLLNATKSTYDAILSAEDNAMQQLLANSLIQAGGAIYAKGVENVWIGFGELIATWGIKGGEQMAVGGLQIGAGLGMGAVGKAILPSSSSAKDDSAKVENQMAKQDKPYTDESKIYMFPSEQKWLEEINRANKKISR
jgi:hypothetical protein